MRFLIPALLLTSAPCTAEIRLPKIIGSNMVLQRNSDVKVWGWADPGEEVRVTGDWWVGTQLGRADTRGRWQVLVETGDAGGPHTMSIAGANTIELENLLFGEVWIGSGQSNMEMPLVGVSNAYTGILDAEREVAEATFPDIRLFQVGNYSSKEPLEDVEPGIEMYGVPPAACEWQACTPSTVSTFASTAYFFARALHRELDIPIGIIDASWGGTSAETWTPVSGLKRLGYEAELEQAAERPQATDQKIPTRLYNGMVHPLRHVAIKGVIWYQGEGNASKAEAYHELFPMMIGAWREAFDNDVSFYYVQIAPFDYGRLNAAYLREAQLESMSIPGTGMVVTMDVGDLRDIHPKSKQEVGQRLALWALANDYGRDVECSGPLHTGTVFKDGAARLSFDHADGGLATRDGQAPSHFEIAGEDRQFHPATAVIDGDELVVSSEQVSDPVAVRYAFTSVAMPNLMNRDGLPASPFRTDLW